jgi:LemA protein
MRTAARSALLSAQSPADKAEANNQLTGALKTLFAVAENYPELKASNNFIQLQQELTDTEDKVAYSRQFYNSNVTDFNTKVATFPSSIIANMFGFKPFEFFTAADADRKRVDVKF